MLNIDQVFPEKYVDYILKSFKLVPNCVLLLGRWYCCSTQHIERSEAVTDTSITLAALWKCFSFHGNISQYFTDSDMSLRNQLNLNISVKSIRHKHLIIKVKGFSLPSK